MSREGVYARDPVTAERLWQVSVFMTSTLAGDAIAATRNSSHVVCYADDDSPLEDEPAGTSNMTSTEPNEHNRITRT